MITETTNTENLSHYQSWQLKTYGNILPAGTGHFNENSEAENFERWMNEQGERQLQNQDIYSY